MRSTIQWYAASAADDAALEGLRDLVDSLADNDYRLIGGLALSLLIHAAVDTLPAEVTQRSTADNDAALTEGVLAATSIDETLRSRLYTRTAGNRWELERESGEASAIDVVIPSRQSRKATRNVGDLVVDALPGVLAALDAPPVLLDVDVTLRATSENFVLPVLVSSPLGMLVSKSFACRGRAKDTDWPDMWRALEVANAAGFDSTSPEWDHPEAVEGATFINQRLLNPNRVIADLLCPELADDARLPRITRIRALTQRIVPADNR